MLERTNTNLKVPCPMNAKNMKGVTIFLDHFLVWVPPSNSHLLWTGLGKFEPPWTFWDLIPSKGGALLHHW